MLVLCSLVLGIELLKLFKQKVECLSSLSVFPFWLFDVVLLDEAKLFEKVLVFALKKLVLLVGGGHRLVNPLVISPCSNLWWNWSIIPLNFW